MKFFFLHPPKFIIAFIIFSLLCCCDNNDSNSDNEMASEETITEAPSPGQNNKTTQNQPAYNRTEKSINGKEFYQYNIDDFPLNDEPWETVRQKAKTGDPAAQYELGRRLSKGEGVTRDIQNGIKC
jgi:hypothetical protein